MYRVVASLFLLAVCGGRLGAADGEWTLARNQHFEVYSQAGPADARAGLDTFEHLRAFFENHHLLTGDQAFTDRPPVRVIGFRSKADYEAYRLRRTADAFYVGAPERDWIVMPGLRADLFNVAAHEYVHLVMYGRGLILPRWLSEGLAEVFSTLAVNESRCEVGGAPAGRLETLRRSQALSAAALFAVGEGEAHSSPIATASFYAESWALLDMLTSEPEYASKLSSLVAALSVAGSRSEDAMSDVYGKSGDQLTAAARMRALKGGSARRSLEAARPDPYQMQVETVSHAQAEAVIADLLLASGEYERAEELLREELPSAQRDAERLAALGVVYLKRGNRTEAIHYWQKAVDAGLRDADICYRYALLAQEMQLPSEQRRNALEVAISIRGSFDDARYELAVLSSNEGKFDRVVEQLEAMRTPQGKRAYQYWTMLAYALTNMDRRDEAVFAAEHARAAARNADEKTQAAQLAYMARTDLQVQMRSDENGKPTMVTTRVLHGTTSFNPFVLSNDQIVRTDGKLSEVSCSAGKLTGFLLQTAVGKLALLVADPTRVLMRNGPPEFYCGPQHDGRPVRVEYAAGQQAGTGMLRGMEFVQ